MPAILSGDDYRALPRSPETWIVEGLLPSGGSMLLFGDPKVGKSYAALQLACCLVRGVDWLGFRVPATCPTVYIQLDTSRTLWASRLDELAAEGHPIESIHFADRETLNTFPFNILDPEHFKLLSLELQAISPGVVIVDTLRESHRGDENDSTDMQDVIAHLDAAVKPAALVLISHARKTSPETGYNLINDNRGSNYVVGRMDAIVRFSEKSMRVSSRTLEEHSINLVRHDDGTWMLGHDDMQVAAMRLLEGPKRPLRELAKDLAEITKKSPTACRAYLRRMQKRLEPRVVSSRGTEHQTATLSLVKG